MSVISFIGNKGGVGKTTLALNIANMLYEQSSVIVLDADPQGSVLHWAAMIDSESAPPVIDATHNTSQIIAENRVQADYILIDCPPQLHAEQTQAVLANCDVAVIPVLPSPLDLWATVAVSESVSLARQINPGLQVLLVINQLEPRTRLSRMVQDAIMELDVPVAKTNIHRRVVYRSSVLEGKSVNQMGKPGSIATEEINQLLKEISGGN